MLFRSDGIKIFVPVFVDDITLASRSQEAQDTFVAELATHCKLCDLEPTSLLLEIDITRDRPNQKLYLSQHQYIINKMAEFGMTDCKSVGTPMTPGLQLSKEDSPKTDEELLEMKNIPYMNAVGSLLYISGKHHKTRYYIYSRSVILLQLQSRNGTLESCQTCLPILEGNIGYEVGVWSR